MFFKLVGLFIVVPLVEMVLLVFIGSNLGVLPTTALIVTTAVVGAWLTKREGLGILAKLQQDLAKGIPPASRIAEGALILAGGLLLLTPGIFTDITGFLLTIPWTRRRIAPVLLRFLSQQFMSGNAESRRNWHVAFDAKLSTPPTESTKSSPDPFDHPVP